MKKILFIGFLSFMIAALWLLPLTFVKPYVEKAVAGLTLKGVSGTIWNGKAQQFSANNTDFGQVTWNVKPLQSLLSLSLKANFKIDGEDLDATGLAGLTINKNLILDKTQFDLSAKHINKIQKNAKLTGNFKGNIVHAIIAQQKVPQINGTVDWKNGAVTSPIKLEPGDYRAVIKPSSGDLELKLTSTEAPIELNGDLLLKKDWTFVTDLKTKTKNPGIAAMLKFAGKQQANGTIVIKQNGNLKPFIGL